MDKPFSGGGGNRTRATFPRLDDEDAATNVVYTRAREAVREWVARGFVYFVQEGADGPVKIGWTLTDPDRRVRELQTGNPRLLRIIGVAPGAKLVEQRIHDELSAHRLVGEWFSPAPAVMAAIERVAIAVVDDGDGWFDELLEHALFSFIADATEEATA